MGTLAAFYLQRHPYAAQNNPLSNILSFSGLLLILFSILTFDKDIISPGWPLLAPTVGAVLIIIFCASNSFVFQILSSKIFVFLGLLSYSLYLWSQPTFSYLRAYSIDRPSSFEFIYLLPFIFLLSFLTWKYVESPFRNKLIIKKNFILIFTLSLTFFFITVGLYLNKSYGMPYRFFSKDISKDDVDKRIYNEKVFLYKKDYFSYKSLTNILIVGASQARDFTNITLENFDISQVEIVYRNDLKQCIESQFFDSKYTLYDQADVIVFVDGYNKSNCYLSDIAYAESRNKKIFYIGIINFGYNLNWLARIDKSNRGNQYNIVPISILQNERDMVAAIPSKNFISLLAPVLFESKIPITDELGRLLSADRLHLTKYGAIFYGQKAIVNSSYANLFK
jgi:hypothetical protein